MNVTVLTALDGSDLVRQRNWSWLKEHAFPSWWERKVGYSTPGPAWSKGEALADAAARASGDVFVVADADLWVAEAFLVRAVELVARREAPWVVPHGTVYRLSLASTNMLVADRNPPDAPAPARRAALERREHVGPVGGGIVVCTRAAWDTVGGIDARFTGWGGEDISFGRALDTLVGAHARIGATAWHLWHRRMYRRPGNRASEANEALAGRYLDATGDPDAMRALVAEAKAARP